MFYNYRPDGLSEKGMSKITPGPWYVIPSTRQVADKEVWFDVDGSRHGETPNMVIDCNSVEDAHLISAAHEMLSALKAVLPILDRAFEYDGDVFGIKHNDAVDTDELIRAAIAKAEGE